MATITFRTILLFALCSGIVLSPVAYGQNKPAKSAKAKKPIYKKPAGPYEAGPLFNSDSLLEFTLTGNLKEIMTDRDANNVSDHPMLLTYAKGDGAKESFPIEVRSRGHFRRMKTNCDYPPLWIDFDKESKLKKGIFQKQNKLKLVTPCQGDDYVVREYLLYKVYSLFTPTGLSARLAKVTFEDSVGKYKTQTKYCFLIENETRAGKRNGLFIEERKQLRSELLHKDEFTRVAVFEYLIGNTDWSVPYLHNIILAFKDTTAIPTPIPYDFDHSGMVLAPYAYPPEQLGLSSVRERRYRGYCQNLADFQSTFDEFNKKKDEIYKIYTDCPYIDDKYKKYATKYLDDFYKTIDDPKRALREFGYPCVNKEKITIAGYENQ